MVLGCCWCLCDQVELSLYNSMDSIVSILIISLIIVMAALVPVFAVLEVQCASALINCFTIIYQYHQHSSFETCINDVYDTTRSAALHRCWFDIDVRLFVTKSYSLSIWNMEIAGVWPWQALIVYVTDRNVPSPHVLLCPNSSVETVASLRSPSPVSGVHLQQGMISAKFLRGSKSISDFLSFAVLRYGPKTAVTTKLLCVMTELQVHNIMALSLACVCTPELSVSPLMPTVPIWV